MLHLKECEWRYSYRREDLLPLVKKLFRRTYLDEEIFIFYLVKSHFLIRFA